MVYWVVALVVEDPSLGRFAQYHSCHLLAANLQTKMTKMMKRPNHLRHCLAVHCGRLWRPLVACVCYYGYDVRHERVAAVAAAAAVIVETEETNETDDDDDDDYSHGGRLSPSLSASPRRSYRSSLLLSSSLLSC